MNCPTCGSTTRFIKGGTSKKTGKPYPAFYACENKDCSWTQNAQQASQQPPQQAPKTNWDKISFGKCKHAYLLEMFKKGFELTLQTEQLSEKWAEMSMRKLGEPDLKDYGDGEQADQIPYA